jgi:hypothetical protein
MTKARASACATCRRESLRVLAAAIALMFLVVSSAGQSQSSTQQVPVIQLWVDYDPTWRIKDKLVFDIIISPRAAVDPDTFWEFLVRPQFTYNLARWIDLTGGVFFAVTNQATAVDTIEPRPYVGVMVKHTIWRGIQLSNYARVEFRFQFDEDDRLWVTDQRFRNRVEALIPINKKNLSEVGVYYALADAEWFWNNNQQLQERFQSQRRYRLGVGWKQSRAWNFQMIYTLQRARNTINEPFSTMDDIIRFRFIHTLK